MKRLMRNLFKKNSDLSVDEQISRRTAISFFVATVAAGSGIWGWLWLRKQPVDGGLRGGIQQPLRDALNTNEKVFNKTLSSHHLAKVYSKQQAVAKARVNGDVGMNEDFEAADWKLSVQKKDGKVLELTLADIKNLPKTEVIYDFKCIEGWSEVS